MTIDGIKDIIKGHLSRKWNSAVTGLATHIFYVECGIKTGFIWDVGPPIDLASIIKIMTDLIRTNLISHHLRVLRILDDFCILNIQSYLNINLDDITFVNITSTLSQPQICSFSVLTPFIAAFNQQIKNFQISEEILLDVVTDNSVCIPTLFGLVAGFPIIYYYDPLVSDKNCLANIPLNIYQIWFRNEILLFSVSCPLKLIEINLKNKIEQWKGSVLRNNDLVLKIFQETLSVVIL